MFGNWCSGMGIGSLLLMIALWVGLIAGAIWAIDRLLPSSRSSAGSSPSGPGTAIDILDRRLAAGEIDTDTHQRLLATLATGARG